MGTALEEGVWQECVPRAGGLRSDGSRGPLGKAVELEVSGLWIHDRVF